ncbi:uncharacterized protein LODBEIA_P50000 [Lodderomyces beijingensis]|uniref:Autophagy-related protein 11 n=1 Tax=Lodderomyces beijingensis TaxID=1775926 RepID=A0ABP0ZUH3_9ASCO
MPNISYLTAHSAHNGSSVKIPKPIRFHTFNELKEYLSQVFPIESTDDVFLLSSFGIKVNFNLINETSDIFIFDKRLFVPQVDGGLVNSYISKCDDVTVTQQEPERSPLAETQVSSRQGLQNLIRIYNGWAKALLQDSMIMENSCQQLVRQINIIFQSLSTILQFANNFIDDIEKNFNHHHNYLKLINHKTLHKTWSERYKNLQQLPPVKIGEHRIVLVAYLDSKALSQSSQFVTKYLPLILQKFTEMRDVIVEVNNDRKRIDAIVESFRKESIQKFKNIHVKELVQQVQSKVHLVAEGAQLQNPDLAQLQQFYSLHKSSVSVELLESARRLHIYLKELRLFRENLIRQGPQIFHTIANLQMKMVEFRTELRSLVEKDANRHNPDSINSQTIALVKKCEDELSLTIDLPLLMGLSMIEKRRQFEWNDFFSKGIVRNANEQFATLIDHEKAFRSIWNKKFGSLLDFIGDDSASATIRLPSVDVSLAANNFTSVPMLKDIEVEREDILNYISLLETSTSTVSKSFPELLRKNFSDMRASTNNMKKVTKMISSMGSITSPNNARAKDSSLEEKSSGELDVDLNVVYGLKSRIAKLESLLHQHQYKNITNWPVTRNGSYSDNRMSMIVDSKQVANSDPTKLLQKRRVSSNESRILTTTNNSQVLDGSSIDKHLDNLRLRKNNSELKSKNELLTKDVELKDKEMANLRQQLAEMKASHSREIDGLTRRVSEEEEKLKLAKSKTQKDEKEIEQLKVKLEEKDQLIADLNTKLSKADENISKSSKETVSLNETLTTLRGELADATKMKNDLLSNMSSKESEFALERNSHNNDLARLKSKFEEVTEDYENLMELTQVKQKKHDALVHDLNNVVINLMNIVKHVCEKIFQDFWQTCYILESMGLLLTKEGKNYQIKRVKGLKSKKVHHEDDQSISTTAAATDATPNFKVIEEIEAKMSWTDEIPSMNSLSPDTYSSGNDSEIVVDKFSEQSEKIIVIYNDLFKFDVSSRFDVFLRSISFVEHVQLVDENSNTSHFFANAILKRFKDVEGFAKKLSKEIKLKDQELKKLTSRAKNKISVNHFQENDLLLFLPTKVDRGSYVPKENAIQPWAAFNVGSPHHFLQSSNEHRLEGKEWLIGRVKKITERKVDQENFESVEENPFRLSIGVTWYLVEAEEN